MNITQRQLRLFTATAAAGSLSGASQRLHLSQPAFTRALQALEAQLGVRLFERTTRRLALTAEGRRFLPAAQRLLAEMDQALAELHGQPAGLAGSVTIALGSAFGGSVMPALLKTWHAQHPAVRLALVDDNSRGITARVLQGEADLGIGSVLGAAPGLVTRVLLSAPLGLLAHPLHHRLPQRATMATAAALPLVKEADDTSVMQLLRAHGSPLVAAMERGVEVTSLSLQLALVHAGVGVAVLSALGASHPQAAGLRFVPLSPRVERQVVLMHRRDRPLRAPAQALVDALGPALAAAQLHAQVRREKHAES